MKERMLNRNGTDYHEEYLEQAESQIPKIYAGQRAD